MKLHNKERKKDKLPILQINKRKTGKIETFKPEQKTEGRKSSIILHKTEEKQKTKKLSILEQKKEERMPKIEENAVTKNINVFYQLSNGKRWTVNKNEH
jgi:hypothetical protein